jgi:hypothetical protein
MRVLTLRTAAWVVGSLAIVLGASVVVGYAADSWDGFDWNVASVFGTALGTTALAGFTGALVFATKEEQAARNRPIVILKEITFNGSASSGTAHVELANIGLGPARNVELWISNDFEAYWAARGWGPVIRAGEVESVKVFVSMSETSADIKVHPSHFKLIEDRSSYTDGSGENTYRIISDQPPS